MTSLDQVYVQPGEVHWSLEPRIFKTVLGSCVSVCLWDEVHGIGGLTHYMLPYARGEIDSARFGDVAIPLLAARLRALGSIMLVAKVFGGARVTQSANAVTVGDSNIAAAFALLAVEGIAVVAQRTGGTDGVVIEFSTEDGAVMLRKIKAHPGIALPNQDAWPALL